ncbi:hypothetical protein JCM19379_05240 [Methyloparacoccus murrellii]
MHVRQFVPALMDLDAGRDLAQVEVCRRCRQAEDEAEPWQAAKEGERYRERWHRQSSGGREGHGF